MMTWRVGLVTMIALLAVTAVIVAALQVRNLPVAPPAPTSALTPTGVAPSPETTSFTFSTPALLNVEKSVEIVLPPGWQQLNVDAIDIQKRFAAVASPPRYTTDASTRLLTNAGQETMVVTAALVDAEIDSVLPATLTIAAIARNTLTLEGYLAAVEGILLSNGIQVHITQIDGNLRTDGLPVATMHYTLKPQEVDAYQVVAYDALATTLIIFTFMAPTAHYTEFLPKFHEVVRSVIF